MAQRNGDVSSPSRSPQRERSVQRVQSGARERKKVPTAVAGLINYLRSSLPTIGEPNAQSVLPGTQAPGCENSAKKTGGNISRALSLGSPGILSQIPQAYYNFFAAFKNERTFTNKEPFAELTRIIFKHRVSCWESNLPSEIKHAVTVLRITLRSKAFHEVSLSSPCQRYILIVEPNILPLPKLYAEDTIIKSLASILKSNVGHYFQLVSGVDTVLAQETLAELCSLFEKILGNSSIRKLCVKHEVHHSLVSLLSASEPTLLRIALMGVVRIVKEADASNDVGGHQCVKIILQIIEDDYPSELKRLAAEALFRLAQGRCSSSVCKLIRILDGVRCIVDLLHFSDPKLHLRSAGVLEAVACDADGRTAIRNCGGIGALLKYLHPELRPRPSPDLLHSICAALTQLAGSDLNASLIREQNGIYFLSSLLLLDESHIDLESVREGDPSLLLDSIFLGSFRCLRCLFSVERNRRMFKRLFPPVLFEKFLQIPHYCHDEVKYESVVACLKELPEQKVTVLKSCIQQTDLGREADKFIGDYGILEEIGSGAFGTVYRVQLKSDNPIERERSLAMKEILTRPSGGTFGMSGADDGAQSAASIENEARILETLDHPNLVHYHRSFSIEDRMYLVMELVEGADLLEVVESYTEKGMQFTDKQLWSVLVQMCSALSYLHKKKNIVHRDIKPANVRLDHNNRIKIIDFGLAKQKPEGSLMQSTCGTLQYSCPEVIQGKAYGSKADIWALGCVIYQLATLKAPFESRNMLTLAKRIVEADFVPITNRPALFTKAVEKCLTADLKSRPDISEVCSLIAPILMEEIDQLHATAATTARELETEKTQRQRYQSEAEQYKKTIHIMVQNQLGNDANIDESSVESITSTPASTPATTPALAAGGAFFSTSGPPTRSTSGPALVGNLGSYSPARSSSRIGRRGSFGRPGSGLARTLKVQAHELPPAFGASDEVERGRFIVDRYKRALFSRQSGSVDLKSELKMLSSGSSDLIRIDLGIIPREQEWLEAFTTNLDGGGAKAFCITYARMHKLIEMVLQGSGYYNLQIAEDVVDQ